MFCGTRLTTPYYCSYVVLKQYNNTYLCQPCCLLPFCAAGIAANDYHYEKGFNFPQHSFFGSLARIGGRNARWFTAAGLSVSGATAAAALLLKEHELRPRWLTPVSCATTANQPGTRRNSPEREAAIRSLNVVADVADEISPAVVSITGASFVTKSSGSGFIVDSDGHIITNAHVVANRRMVRIKTADGATYNAVVLAVHTSHDLALLRVQAPRQTTERLTSLPFAPVSHPDKVPVRPGEFVLAAGSPLELNNTITTGVVSAIERDLGHMHGLKYIQTDAIITFGNSGGPLVNLHGQVIGMNTMVAGTGLGFAIPVNTILEFYKRAQASLRGDSQSQAFISDSGISTKNLKYLGVVMASVASGNLRGAFVRSVMENSPAQKAGLLEGDVIIEVNGTPIRMAQQVQDLVNANEELTIVILRRDRQLVLEHVEPARIEK